MKIQARSFAKGAGLLPALATRRLIWRKAFFEPENRKLKILNSLRSPLTGFGERPFETEDLLFETEESLFEAEASVFETEESRFEAADSLFETEDPLFGTEDLVFETAG